MNKDSPAPCRRIVASDVDGTRRMVLLDQERAVGCITPLLHDPARDPRGVVSKVPAIELPWRRPG
jgi:hypothetical protein